MNIEIIGFLAGLFTTVEVIPQVIKSFKTKSTGDISLPALIMVVVGSALWLVYGIGKGSASITLTCSITTIIYLCLVFLKLKYDGRNK